MSGPSRHTEWLSLVEVSGAFLALPVLEKAFPQGLDVIETPRRQRLRAAYEEWRDAVDEDDPLLPELHREWIRLVFKEILEYDCEVLKTDADTVVSYAVASPERTDTFSPDWIVVSPCDAKPRIFVSLQPPGTDLEKVRKDDRWPVSLRDRMTALCRVHGVRLGLLTDGERWMLVNAPSGATSGDASWYARLWFQEPLTLKAFQSLLGVRRCFGPADETLDALLEKSLQHHEEITDTLGEQVRRAVEVLVQCLDKADADRNRELLRDVSPTELYEAGLTVMMRLVFVLCAEERGLLLSGDPVYDECYAVSTLRGQLAEEADRHGPEVLERRHDAWARLLSVFRAIYGGIDHESLRMPALGGSLFDPDRFPFLEGRPKGTTWRDSDATPLPIDNRTVMLLLNSLQSLEQHGGALLLSYRALDVEQIGHVYEGLLEHTVARVPSVTLGLDGSKNAKNPNLTLSALESARLDGEEALVTLVMETTGRSRSAISNALARPVEEAAFGQLLSVCGGDTTLAERIRPFANLLRADAWGDPTVYRGNAFMVTLGADRRETGTHYTPKSLTEKVAETTLEPIVYVGPAEGRPRDKWKLKTSYELLALKICDLAMGSGAFLVQSCRWLAERLVEAWTAEEATGKYVTVDGDVLDEVGHADPMPTDMEERLIVARRLIAERCLYGVDVNPLAVELAKLSIWLVTLAKGRPFGFLDHNLRCGDSLLGIHRLEQLTTLKMNPDDGQHQQRLFGHNIEDAVAEAIEIRNRLRSIPIRDIRDVETMARLNSEVRKKLQAVELIADAMIGEVLRANGNSNAIDSALDYLAIQAGAFLNGDEKIGMGIARDAGKSLSVNLSNSKPPRKPFHWALQFPEIYDCDNRGFDAVVSNPPYLGGKRISGKHGDSYRTYLMWNIAHGRRGSADLCAYFVIRIWQLIKNEGNLGVVATSSMAEGDTREIGLDYLLTKDATIYQAIQSQPWPGSASVTVTPMWITKRDWNGLYLLNGKQVRGINGYLHETGAVEGTPFRLCANSSISFQGSVIHGQGFVLEKGEAEYLIKKDLKNREIIFPYLRGEDFNSNFDHSTPYFVINFRDWPLEKAMQYEDCINIVIERVKPVRAKLKDKGYREKWWQYGRRGVALYQSIKDLDRVLFHSFTSKYVAFSFVPSSLIYAAPHVVFSLREYEHFATLQSTVHEIWVRNYTSYSLSLARYTPTDCFETFPFPPKIILLHEIGKTYYEYRQLLMLQNRWGLTDIYNHFHNPDNKNNEIQQLRKIHIDMDIAVSELYGWIDIDLKHDFYNTTRDGVRFTISEEARLAMLQMLLKLNHERYHEEVRKGCTPNNRERPRHESCAKAFSEDW